MKRIVLCCDGTWNRADQEHNGVPIPSNVVRMAFRVAHSDGHMPQIICYDQGVGTGNIIDRLTGGAFGDGLEENIYDAYRFLIANFEADDELFIFGFSRGAFTARSLGGLIRKCGILKRASVSRYREAIALYRNDQRPDEPNPTKFREAHSVTGLDPIPIHFMGVWDTVGSLGIPLRGLRWLTRRQHQFHDTELSKAIRNGYHALAVDERRGPFEPTLWTHKPKPGQHVEQVWFCGAHSDVGGGYVERGLADVALEWMIEKATGAGLALHEEAVRAYPLDPKPTGALHNSKRGFYVLTPGLDRPIGVGRSLSGDVTSDPDPTQRVHPSVRERWEADPGYRPPELVKYYERHPTP